MQLLTESWPVYLSNVYSPSPFHSCLDYPSLHSDLFHLQFIFYTNQSYFLKLRIRPCQFHNKNLSVASHCFQSKGQGPRCLFQTRPHWPCPCLCPLGLTVPSVSLSMSSLSCFSHHQSRTSHRPPNMPFCFMHLCLCYLLNR